MCQGLLWTTAWKHLKGHLVFFIQIKINFPDQAWFIFIFLDLVPVFLHVGLTDFLCVQHCHWFIIPQFSFFKWGQYQFKMFPLAQTQLWMSYCYWVIILSRSIQFFTFCIVLLLISIFLILVKTHLDFLFFEMLLFFTLYDNHSWNDITGAWNCGLLGIQLYNIYNKCCLCGCASWCHIKSILNSWAPL